jgi:hypothetical protein
MSRYIWFVFFFLWFIGVQILDWTGRLQTAKDIFARRGAIVSVIGSFLTWRWTPIIIFSLLVIVFVAIPVLPSVLAGLWRTEPKIPNVHQTVTSPVGPTYQFGNVSGNITINEGGLSEEQNRMLHESVDKKAVTEMREFAEKYRHGYLIFGLAPNGAPVTYKGELTDVAIMVDWSDLRVEVGDGQVRVSVPSIRIKYPREVGLAFGHNVEVLPLVENEPMPSHVVPDMVYEVDADKQTFLIGFR